MKKISIIILLLSSMLGFSVDGFASHVVGGDISYKYVSSSGTNHTYKVRVAIYGDCSSPTQSTLNTAGTIASVTLYNGTTAVQTINLPKIAIESDVLITPVCPSEINNTTCNGGTIIGIKKYVFEGNIIVSGTSANFYFLFNGNLFTSTAGRSAIINNIVNAGSTILLLKAELNNVNGQNSSPRFTSLPSAFFCLNKPANFATTAEDDDNDAISYSLVSGLDQAAGAVTYVNPYTATAPVPAAAGTFIFNGVTGQAEFTPNAMVNSIVVTKVTDTRNGIQVGSSMREIFFVIINNCNNNESITDINGINNGDTTSSSNYYKEITVCEYQNTVFSFTMNPLDPENDNLTVTGINIPAGSNLTVLNNGTQNPQVTYSWDLSNVAAGTYTFQIQVADDGCPLSTKKLISFKIIVLPFSGVFTTKVQPPCYDMINGKAWIIQSPVDTNHYNFVWRDATMAVIRTTNYSNNGDSLVNVQPGNYYLDAINSRGCSKRFELIIPTPDYDVNFNIDSVICVNSILSIDTGTTHGNFEQLEWDFGNGFTSTDRLPSYQYPSLGTYIIRLIGTTDIGCKDTFYRTVQVINLMTPEFYVNKDSICYGESIHITTDYGFNATNVNWTFGSNTNTLSTTPIPQLDYSFTNTGIQDIAMTVTYVACPTVTFTKQIFVGAYPKVYLGEDQGLCNNAAPIILQNLETPATVGNLYSKWNTGDITPALQITAPGTYALTQTSAPYCATTDSVTITRDCYLEIPNAFTPDGDGSNDYFFPRDLLSKGLTGFVMKIYNRWGQLVFETSNTNGRGWDGKLNNINQPAGVYVYDIDVILKNGKREKYQSNLTLIR